MRTRVKEQVLTAAGVRFHVLHTANSGVVAVRDKRCHGVQQTVHIARGARVRQVLLEHPQAAPALLIDRLIHPHWLLAPS